MSCGFVELLWLCSTQFASFTLPRRLRTRNHRVRSMSESRNVGGQTKILAHRARLMHCIGCCIRGFGGRNEIIVCLLICLAYVTLWPVGGYAIMDDWIYVKALEYLHFNSGLKIFDFS